MKRITKDMVFSVNSGTDEQLAETLRIFERDGIMWASRDKASKFIPAYNKFICIGEDSRGGYSGALTSDSERCGTHYTPEQFHSEFGETKMQGLSLDPKDYETRKLDKVKDAFKCPEGVCIILLSWNESSKVISTTWASKFNSDTDLYHYYATIPGYEIPDEWRTYEPEKSRRMTFGELHRARYNGFEIAWGANYERLSPSFADNRGDESVPNGWYFRPWGTTEWLEPTIDILPKEWGVK